MKVLPSAGCIGLTPGQFQKVFPYHVAVNEAFEIIQLGNKLMDICDDSSVVGTSIDSIFDIESPSNCPWKWDEIETSKKQSFTITLKPSLLSHLKRKDIQSLRLTGDVILQQSDSDTTLLGSPKGAIFLLYLNVSIVDEVNQSIHDNYYLQKDGILRGIIFQKKVYCWYANFVLCCR